MHVVLVDKPVKIRAGNLSRSRPLIEADLTACLGGGLLVLTGDLNAKHVEWNSG
jgi:hypothetical protein